MLFSNVKQGGGSIMFGTAEKEIMTIYRETKGFLWAVGVTKWQGNRQVEEKKSEIGEVEWEFNQKHKVK